uniref:Uncharacterized protein n=1 Tax=Gallus gallus TaxID=9031 RepID=A0A8V0Z586_CHICK
MATARPDAAYSAAGHSRGRTCSPRAVRGRGPAGRAGRGSLPTYTCLALGGAAAAAAALSGVPDPRALGLSPVGRVPGRRGALRGSGLPQRSLNTLLFLAGRPESGRGPALPPPPSNGEAAPGPRPLLAVTCRPGAEEAPESLAVPARAVTKRRPPARPLVSRRCPLPPHRARPGARGSGPWELRRRRGGAEPLSAPPPASALLPSPSRGSPTVAVSGGGARLGAPSPRGGPAQP